MARVVKVARRVVGRTDDPAGGGSRARSVRAGRLLPGRLAADRRQRLGEPGRLVGSGPAGAHLLHLLADVRAVRDVRAGVPRGKPAHPRDRRRRGGRVRARLPRGSGEPPAGAGTADRLVGGAALRRASAVQRNPQLHARARPRTGHAFLRAGGAGGAALAAAAQAGPHLGDGDAARRGGGDVLQGDRVPPGGGVGGAGVPGHAQDAPGAGVATGGDAAARRAEDAQDEAGRRAQGRGPGQGKLAADALAGAGGALPGGGGVPRLADGLRGTAASAAGLARADQDPRVLDVHGAGGGPP